MELCTLSGLTSCVASCCRPFLFFYHIILADIESPFWLFFKTSGDFFLNLRQNSSHLIQKCTWSLTNLIISDPIWSCWVLDKIWGPFPNLTTYLTFLDLWFKSSNKTKTKKNNWTNQNSYVGNDFHIPNTKRVIPAPTFPKPAMKRKAMYM